jgi:putative transposase
MMIDRIDPLPVGKQAELLGISRGTMYYLPRATSQADLTLIRQTDQLHLEHPFMGQCMLVRQLKRQGVQVAHNV